MGPEGNLAGDLQPLPEMGQVEPGLMPTLPGGEWCLGWVIDPVGRGNRLGGGWCRLGGDDLFYEGLLVLTLSPPTQPPLLGWRQREGLGHRG